MNLPYDLYQQFCLSDFSTTMETAIDRYHNSIQSVIDEHAASYKAKENHKRSILRLV